MASLEHYRKHAKALLKAQRAGDPEAEQRLRAVVGERRAPKLADAQLAVAREHGHRSWPALRRSANGAIEDLPDGAEVMIEASESYVRGHPVAVRVRRRGVRYDIDDAGAAVQLAGTPPGWLETATEVVERHALNVNRRGVVFVQGFAGRDLDRLVAQTAETSHAVYAALLERAT